MHQVCSINPKPEEPSKFDINYKRSSDADKYSDY